MESEYVELKSGLTFTSIMAIIYAAVVIEPAVIYLNLVSSVGGEIGWWMPMFVTLLLVTELGALFRRPITRQEATLTYFLSSYVATNTLFSGLLFNEYLRDNPYTIQFGIADLIPYWAAPPPYTSAVLARTFIAQEWVVPILVLVLSYCATLLIDLSLTYIVIQAYIEVEKLPYPLAPMHAQSIITLSERNPEKMKIFTVFAVISFIYGSILYGLPVISGISLIPYPWIDFTRWIEMVLPGASFGIATDLTTIALGWLLPFNAIIWMFISSSLLFIVGNALALKLSHPLFEGWQKEWAPGMALTWIWQRSTLTVWASVAIGISLAAALLPTLRRSRFLARAFKSLSRLTDVAKERGYIPIKFLLLMYLGGTTIGFLLSHWLVPSFPPWILALLWYTVPFIQAILSGRAIAEIGPSVSIPYLKEASILGSGYGGVDIWLAPIMVTSSAGILAGDAKVCFMTGTSWSSYIKGYLIAIPVAAICGFIYWSLFWSMAPIPSVLYPWTVIQWPISAINFSLWATRSLKVFKPEVIGATFMVMSLAYILCEVLHLPFNIIGFAAGFSTPIPLVTNYLIGGLLGRYLSRRLGVEWWKNNVPVILAGLICGLGLVTALIVAFAVTTTALWSLPY
jgi:hypothetical protein